VGFLHRERGGHGPILSEGLPWNLAFEKPPPRLEMWSISWAPTTGDRRNLTPRIANLIYRTGQLSFDEMPKPLKAGSIQGYAIK
jgi:hypothetical protein